MIQNHEQIYAKVTGLEKRKLTGVSYNLTIGKIIDHKGKIYKEFDLPPKGIVNVVSETHLTIPNDLVAYATVKNEMSRKGLLAINIGIIDPGYEGMVASHLINFGSDNYKLKTGEVFLRLTFHKFDPPEEPKLFEVKHTEKQYIADRQIEARAYLGRSFLNIDATADEIRKEVLSKLFKDFFLWGALFTLLVAGATFALTFGSAAMEKLNTPIAPDKAHTMPPNFNIQDLQDRLEALEKAPQHDNTSETNPKSPDQILDPQVNEN